MHFAAQYATAQQTPPQPCSDQTGPVSAAAPPAALTAERSLQSCSGSLERPGTPSATAQINCQCSSDAGSVGPSSPTACSGEGPQSPLECDASAGRQSSPFDVLLLAAQMSSEGAQAGQRSSAQKERSSRVSTGARVLPTTAWSHAAVPAGHKAAALGPWARKTKRAHLGRRTTCSALPLKLRLMLVSSLIRQQQRLRLISNGVATVMATLPPQDAAELNAARTFLSLF
ncbi:hypothetical protein ABPG77_010250 [Micractinium sp. CCAP 211/92]